MYFDSVLTAWSHFKKGLTEEENDLRNALTCYTEGIEVNCKDDALNAGLYFLRSRIHHRLGEFAPHIHFLF